MAAPPDLAPAPPPDPTNMNGIFDTDGNWVNAEVSFGSMPNPPSGQNHQRNSPFALDGHAAHARPWTPPPPPSTAALQQNVDMPVPPPVIPQPEAHMEDAEDADGHSSGDGEGDDSSEDGSEGDRDGSDDGDAPRRRHRRSRWEPIHEDKSLPCEDELAYIESRPESSAVDEAYWAKETYFDLNDPEIIPKETGQIQWTVDNFNGTRDAPNEEKVRRSDSVTIGGYEWRLKLYPRGNRSDYLSVYLENVTMQSAEFEEFEDFESLPFPVLAGEKTPQKPRSCAVQLSVVMYNPAEPRTHESQTDAHQFTKKSPDYGWTRFTRYGLREFYHRNHGQRQAILRDDKLAFVAYIRVINDPTGCLWAHGKSPYDDSIAMTSLRPWSPQHPQFAAYIPLLHFAPLRDVIYRCSEPSSIVGWLQMFLWKMLSRSRSQSYGLPLRDPSSCDPVHWLTRAARCLRQEADADIIRDLIGTFDPSEGAAVAGNRLKTRDKHSVQTALDSHRTRLATPALLTLELERQYFDRTKRKWEKITNKVDLPNHVHVNGVNYTLFAFSTHLGALTSCKFNFYIRPNGTQGMWYGYTDGQVSCLTHKQAVEKHIGVDPGDPATKPRPMRHSWRTRNRSFSIIEDDNEVAQMVMYVRDDIAISAFCSSVEEKWDVPESAKHAKPPPPPNEDHLAKTEIEGSLGAGAAAAAAGHPAAAVHSRSCSSEIAAGHASPEVWLRDTEGDIVMSDASDGEDEDEDANDGNDNDDDDNDTVDNDDNHENNDTNGDNSGANRLGSDDPAATVQIQIDHFGKDFYEGDWQRGGVYHGQGHLIQMSGDEYRGSFRHGKPHGQGTMVYAATGNTYTGAWRKGQHHGTGTLTEAATGNVFEGGWKQGRKSGAFVLRGSVTDEDKGTCSICYDRELNTAFYDCGHVVACKACATMLEHCPICRRRVLGRVELFGVKVRVE